MQMTKNFFRVFIINMKINNVTFGAKPINHSFIRKIDKNSGKFVKIPVNFVKLEADNKFDMSAMNNIAEKWKDAKYIRKIATASHWMNARKFVEIDVYALTTQEKNFEILKPKKIVGCVEMRNDERNPKSRKVYYLQVKPSMMNVNNPENKYERVGSTILDSLKKIYKSLSLYSDDNKAIKKFYKRNGFIEDYNNKNHYSWSLSIFERLKIRYNAFIRKNGF